MYFCETDMIQSTSFRGDLLWLIGYVFFNLTILFRTVLNKTMGLHAEWGHQQLLSLISVSYDINSVKSEFWSSPNRQTDR